MRILVAAAVATLSVSGLLRAGSASPLVNPVGGLAPNDAGVDATLAQLDAIGKQLKQFSAKLKLTETDQALGTSTVRTGSVTFQKTPDGGARIHVLFDHRIDEERKLSHPEKVEYLLDGPWLIDRNYNTKNEVKRQVLKPGQKMDLFKLGEGPFPLPIGQDPREVHKVFDVKSIAPAKDDPAGTDHLELKPKADSELAKKFYSLDVWVDRKTHMPVRVDTLDPNKQTSRSTELNGINVNPPGGLPDSDFTLPNIDADNWNRHVE